MMVIVNTVLCISPCKNHEHIQRTNALCNVLLYTLCTTIEINLEKKTENYFLSFQFGLYFYPVKISLLTK